MRITNENADNLHFTFIRVSVEFQRRLDERSTSCVISLSTVTEERVGVGKEPPGDQGERVWVREIFEDFELRLSGLKVTYIN